MIRMLDLNTIYEKVKSKAKEFMTKSRFKHALAVEECVVKLAKIHNLDSLKLRIAAISHDMFRDLKDEEMLDLALKKKLSINDLEKANPILLHGKLAATYLKENFNISKDIYLAVMYHTSGHPDFDNIGKTLVIADSIEMNRVYPDVEKLRELAMSSIEEAYFQVIKNKIIYAIERNFLVLPESMRCWNKMILNSKYDFSN